MTQQTKQRVKRGDFSDREHQVLKLMAFGMMDKEIAYSLHISPSTVEAYGSKIRERFGAGTRTEAVAAAILLELVSSEEIRNYLEQKLVLELEREKQNSN